MNSIEAIVKYHERTKHHPNRYAPSLGYMDWANQPDPFRRYEGSELRALPLSLDASTPSYCTIFEPDGIPPAPLNRESLSRLLQFSLGLAAWKSIGSDRWALRCNASSGNLHPTETYLLLPPLAKFNERSSLVHYAPKEHGLECLAEFDSTFWERLPEGSLLLLLTSVIWREAWKYGERAFRYCQLDAGHAQRAVEVSAAMLGWKVRRLDADPGILETLSGTGQEKRFPEEEHESVDMLLLITPERCAAVDPAPLADDIPGCLHGRANRLSPSHHRWEAIEFAETATRVSGGGSAYDFATLQRHCDTESKSVVLGRRSARAMDFGRATIAKAEFSALMQSVAPKNPLQTPVHFVLFIHHVEELPSGLYMLVRNPEHLETLKAATRPELLWQDSGDGLYLLEAGDFRAQAKFISCSQDIASDSAFSMGMLCEFAPQLQAHGAHRYKELFWECGAIGQQLYLETTSLKLSATGIGCFLDDVLHRMLGLEENGFQSLYHFTIGRAIPDLRLETHPPYETKT